MVANNYRIADWRVELMIQETALANWQRRGTFFPNPAIKAIPDYP